jgi:cardiolipin synthase
VVLTCGNKVEVHSTGSSGLEAMLTTIRAATRRIHLETYILRADETGCRFFRALEERARDGVEVRLLYDDFGARGITRRVLAPMHAAGVKTAVFRPLRRLRLRERDHRKILVVDDLVAFTGGLNVANECFSGLRSPVGPWRDLHLQIEGPAARDLDRVFEQSWAIAAGGDVQLPSSPMHEVASAGEGTLSVLPDGPRNCPQRLRDLLRREIEVARRSALIVSPYFIPGASIRRAMGDAVSRGVDVEVLIAGTNDHPLVAWAVQAMLTPYLESGVKVTAFREALMHAKVAVFDDERAIVGTSNYDQQSLHYSYEVNLLAVGGELPRQLATIVRADMDQAIAVTTESLAQRHPFERTRDALAAALVSKL